MIQSLLWQSEPDSHKLVRIVDQLTFHPGTSCMKRSLLGKLRFSRGILRRRVFPESYCPRLEALEMRLAPSANVLTYHNDNFSTGRNLS